MSARRESSARADAKILERGNIYFAYRPRVDVQTVHGLEDVQRLSVLLGPRGRDSYRLIVIGQKRLPAVDGDRTAWGFVEKVASDPEAVEDELDPKRYLTTTHGERDRPAARPAGEGVYAIVRHRGHTHLVYVLELPAEPGEVQRALNIAREASHIEAGGSIGGRGALRPGRERLELGMRRSSLAPALATAVPAAGDGRT